MAFQLGSPFAVKDYSLERCPSKKLKEGNIPKPPSLTSCQSDTTPIQTRSKETVCRLASPSTRGTATNCSKQSMVDVLLSDKTENLSRGKKVVCSQLMQQSTLQKYCRKGRQAKSLAKSLRPSAGGEEGNAGVNTAEEIVEKECITIIAGGMRGSQAKMLQHFPSKEFLELMRNQKQQLDDPTRHEIKEINQLGGENNPKKRRGRPRKLSVESPKVSVSGKVHNRDVVAADEIVVKDCIMSEGELHTVTRERSTRMRGLLPGEEHLKFIGNNKKLLSGPLRHNKLSSTKKMPPTEKDKLPNEVVVQASSKQLEKNSSKRGRKRKSMSTIESSIQDSQDASRGKTVEVFETDSKMKGVDMAIDDLPSSISDVQHISMWLEEMHSPTTVDCSRFSPGRTVQQYTETSVRQEEIAMQHPAVDANNGIASDDSPRLPFVKTFPLWKMIESMEVFQVMPQKPHFQPLNHCREMFREGLALASMVTFVSVVKKTRELHFDDPRSVIEDCLESILDLENHGFDVKMLRDGLTRLLLIKDKQERFQDQLKELRNSMEEHNHERSKIHDEINEIDQKLSELEGKRSLVMLMKGTKASEIASLQARVDAINQDIRSLQLDFQGLAAAPW